MPLQLVYVLASPELHILSKQAPHQQRHISSPVNLLEKDFYSIVQLTQNHYLVLAGLTLVPLLLLWPLNC